MQIKIFTVILSLIIFIAIIITTFPERYLYKNETEYYKKNEHEEVEILTNDQEAFLVKIFMNEDRIRSGKLYDYQKEVLKQYNYSMDYLAKKYPSHHFKITDCEYKNKLNSYTTFWFSENDDTENIFELYLRITENEQGNIYFAEDNYYGYLFSPVLKNYFYKIIDPLCDEIYISTKIQDVKGEDYDELMQMEDIINGDLNIEQRTAIHIKIDDADTCAQKAEELEAAIKEALGQIQTMKSTFVLIYWINVPDDYTTEEEYGTYLNSIDKSTNVYKHTFHMNFVTKE